ncbi:MAG: hypothetical protein QNJ18_01320 [Xenococcaceae cyanobacterium MO_167.B52]|nr:hypothetical protein [Xenococcaceae cyanobacterium MO_167.B52]
MSSYKTTTGISVTLLLMTYGVFGWIYGSWVIKVLEDEGIKNLISQVLEPEIRLVIFYGIGAIYIMAVAIVFTSPITLITMGLNKWLKSDVRAFFLVFLGAFAFALIVQRLDFFATFLMLLANAILVKLDLQSLGLSRWLSYCVLTVMCLGSFFGGITAFYYWG